MKVKNRANISVSVREIRDADGVGKPHFDLGAGENHDLVLAEIVGENPSAHIGSQAKAPHGDYLGVRDDLTCNMASKQSLLLAAGTANRFLTVSHLKVSWTSAGEARIASFTTRSTRTTRVMLDRDQIARDQQVLLSFPVALGRSLSLEQVMFASGPNYFHLLENHRQALHRLQHFHFNYQDDPMAWWISTAFYSGINTGEALANAQWLASCVKAFGYKYFHIDEGHEYPRGEYTTPNAKQFPDGMWIVEHKLCKLGLVPEIWTGPFEVSDRSWLYEHHIDWLVHDSHGNPICIGRVDDKFDRLHVLDKTNSGAQAYLHRTDHILTRQWGIRYFKLDIMDDSAIEGRLAPNTGHSFVASKEAVANIACRFCMDRNFDVSDLDAFSVSQDVEPQQQWHNRKTPLTLNEAEVQIVLAALTGGMYEIGDDQPTLSSEPKVLALVENQEMIDRDRLGRHPLQLDLMTFPASDEDPIAFFLREESRQVMLVVFNWTEHPTSYTFTMAGLGPASSHPFRTFDVLNHNATVEMDCDTLRTTDQAPHSVRFIKLVDQRIPARSPRVTVRAPARHWPDMQ